MKSGEFDFEKYGTGGPFHVSVFRFQFFLQVRNSHHQCQKMMKKMHSVERRMHSWQSCRETFRKNLKNSWINVQKGLKKILLQMFLWTGKMQFWQPVEKFLTKDRKFFTQCPKMLCEKKILLKLFTRTGRKKFWKPRWKHLYRRPNFFRSQIKNDEKK